jgi:hypothetical protein
MCHCNASLEPGTQQSHLKKLRTSNIPGEGTQVLQAATLQLYFVEVGVNKFQQRYKPSTSSLVLSGQSSNASSYLLGHSQKSPDTNGETPMLMDAKEVRG